MATTKGYGCKRDPALGAAEIPRALQEALLRSDAYRRGPRETITYPKNASALDGKSCIYLSTYLPSYLPIYLPTYRSTYLPNYLSINLKLPLGSPCGLEGAPELRQCPARSEKAWRALLPDHLHGRGGPRDAPRVHRSLGLGALSAPPEWAVCSRALELPSFAIIPDL